MVGVTHAELPSAAPGMDRQLAARPGGWRGARRPDAGAPGAHQHPGVYNACASTAALSAPLATPAGRMRPVLAACVALSLVLGPGAGDGCEDPPSPSFSRSVPAPQLSAEELHSPHMPQALRCDACYAIAFQVGTPKPRWGSRAQHLAACFRLLRREGKGGERWERGVTRGAAITGHFLPQLEEQLSKAEAKLGRKALRESDYVEVLERSCSQSWEL